MKRKTAIRRIRPVIAVACFALSSCVHNRALGPELAGTSDQSDLSDRSDSRAEALSPLNLSLQAAVLTALEHNASFQVERIGPAISRTAEQVQRAAFDPTLTASLGGGQSNEKTETSGVSTNGTGDSLAADARVKEFLATGTTLELGAGQESRSSSNGSDTDTRGTSWDVKISQSLLRGLGRAANLARLRQARLDTEISLYELRGAVESLVTQVEQAYWDCILAERSIEIYESSLEIANREIEEVKERIRVGRIAETELAAAEAEVASRREQLIDARGTFAKRRLNLIRLLNPSGGPAAWTRDVNLSDPPELPVVEVGGVESHVRLAMDGRSDLAQARLRVGRGDIEIVRTRNGLLPKLDFFVSLGGSGYANSFSDRGDTDTSDVSYAAGVNFEMPLGNRDASARHESARLSLDQQKAALRNMEQLVQVDVRSAYVDVESAAERMNATKATRQLREKTLDNEQEKFRVGRSTMFLVSQARRDMVASRIAEVESVIAYRKALLDLYRLDGSILPRRGLDAQ